MSSPTQDAIERLRHAARYGTSSALSRTIKRPWKMIVPLVMRKTGMTKDIEMRTFWGGRMTGTLPEAVSSVIWRFGYFEQGICQTLLETLKPGGVFIDVGAHFGFFSLLSSWLVGEQGRVICVEAMPTTFERLTHNLTHHAAHKNFNAVNVAAFDKETVLDFQDYGLVWSSLNSAFGVRNDDNAISVSQEIKVDAFPLDKIITPFDLPKIDLIKIDAESSEIFVLRGMEKILKNHDPKIIVEIGDMKGATGGESSEIVTLLSDYNYTPYHYRDGKLVAVEIHNSYGYDNFVFKRER